MQTCPEGKKDLVTLLWPLWWPCKGWRANPHSYYGTWYFTKCWVELHTQQGAVSWFSIFLTIHEMNKVQMPMTKRKKKNIPIFSLLRLLNVWWFVLCISAKLQDTEAFFIDAIHFWGHWYVLIWVLYKIYIIYICLKINNTNL